MSCGSLPPRRSLSHAFTSNSRKYAFTRRRKAATASAAAKAGDATSWFTSAGIRCSKLEVVQFRGLRGIGAREDIIAGEILANVPSAASLLVQPTKSSPFKQFCSRELWASYPWYMKMALMLIFEKRKGPKSPFQHYVADLEAIAIDTPVQWTEEEIDELHYPQLESDIRKQRRAWHQLHDKFVREHPESGVSLHESMWALQAVRSRAFSGPYGGPRLQTRGLLAATLLGAGCWSIQVAHIPIEQVLNAGIAAVMFNIIYDFLLSRRLRWYAMIPAIDYCNHSAKVQSSVNFEVFKESFTVTTSHHVREGDQVFINYGAYSNDFLLQYYGFIEEGLPDSYVIMLPRKGDVGTSSKEDRLVISANGALDTSMAVLQEHRPDSPMAALLDLCAQERKRWPTSLEQDQQELSVLLGLQPDNFRQKLALEFRIKKKTTLESCIRHCHLAGSSCQ